MKYFKLPDLGEGLTEAEIVEWHIKPGDEVKVDQLILSVETAKAIVEVPSPQTGVIAACFGEPGDTVHIGEPLVEFEGEQEDSGTVVGSLAKGESSLEEDVFIIGAAGGKAGEKVKATPSVRALARRMQVDITRLRGSGHDGKITTEDIEKAARLNQSKGAAEPLRGVRKAMAKSMTTAHEQVVPVSLCDDADIHAWDENQDVTMRLVHAIGKACMAEPSLNVWFDGEHLTRRVLKQVDLGIAVDTEQGLFVPVLRDITNRPLDNLRTGLDNLRAAVKSRAIPPKEMLGATITLSNYGTMAGRYGSPIVVPPTVAIIGAGKIRDDVVAWQGKPAIHKILPLSVTFDHRAITGGEAARFLKMLLDDLQQPSHDAK